MGDADVNEMPHPGCTGGFDRAPAGSQIDVAKFRRLRGIGVRNSHQLNERVGGLDLPGVGCAIERVADHRLAAWREFRFRAGTNQRAHLVTAPQQPADQRAAYVSGSACDEDAVFLRIHSGLLREASISIRRPVDWRILPEARFSGKSEV